MKPADVELAVATVLAVWDSSEAERDPVAVLDRVMDAIRALADKPRCEHRRTVEDMGRLSDPEERGHLTCLDCGATGSVECCGICSEQFCRCAELNLR